MVTTLKCVVLNTTHEPLSVVSVKRGFRLLIEDKVTVLQYHEDKFIQTVSTMFPAPSVVVVKTYVHRRITTAVYTRRNMFERDNYTCQYCLRTKNQLSGSEMLTRDHIVPESRGGKSTWTNLVTCCSSCNNRKGNKYLAECGMILHKMPKEPTVVEIWSKRFSI